MNISLYIVSLTKHTHISICCLHSSISFLLHSEANTFYCATCSNWFLVKSSEDGNNAQQYSPPNKGVYGMFKDDIRLPKSNVGSSNHDSRVIDPRISNSSHSPSASASKGHSKLVIMEHVRRNICV